jgi:hypothetical protein
MVKKKSSSCTHSESAMVHACSTCIAETIKKAVEEAVEGERQRVLKIFLDAAVEKERQRVLKIFLEAPLDMSREQCAALAKRK